MKRVVVTGSRTWTNIDQIQEWLLRIPPDTVIIHGDCPEGVDLIVDELATAMGFFIIKYPAPWCNSTFGKKAGPVRNLFMLTDSRPDCVKAFRAAGNSPGTDNCIKLAKDMNLPINIEQEKPIDESRPNDNPSQRSEGT